MKRREFIRKSLGITLASGVVLATASYARAAFRGNTDFPASEPAEGDYDLVAVRGGEPDEMFVKGILAMGGMEKFVKRGQTVVVKPNIGWDVPPERAANTNPKLVGKIVELCYKAGAKKVTVFDNPCDEWTRAYKNSGIQDAVIAAGGQMISGKDQSLYKTVNVPKGVTLKSADVHEEILNSDVFINVPVLKNHGGATMTLSMKNLMGVVWDRGWWHRNGLPQCIADFATFRKPDLNVIDGYNVMKRNGPRGVSVNDLVNMKYQLISTDMVAIDVAASKVFGMDIDKVKYIGLAEKLGVGTTNLQSLKIKRIAI